MKLFGWKLFSKKVSDGSLVTPLGSVFQRESINNSQAYLETYSKSLYVYACVSKIAQKVGSIDWHLYQIINTKGEVKEIDNSPLLNLIYKPNPFQTKAEFWESIVIDKKLCGNAFIFKVRNNYGKVVELWRLSPDRVTIISDSTSFIKGYEYRKDDGTTILFRPEDIIHDKYPSPLEQHLGLAPLQPAAVRVDTEEFGSKYQRDFFLNNARPDGILHTEGRLTPQQRTDIKESWARRHQGIGKSSKMALIEGGMTYQQISISQREMDYIESMKFTRDDILVAFGVPKPIVAVTDDVNLANAETGMNIFLSETIKPEMSRIVEKINEELVIPDFGEQYFFDFVDPTPNDEVFALDRQTRLVMANIMTINEARKENGLAPLKDGGDSIYLPLMSVPIGDVAQEKRLSIYRTKSNLFAKRNFFFKKLELQESIIQQLQKKITELKPKQKVSKKIRIKSTQPKIVFTKEQKSTIWQEHDKRLSNDVFIFRNFVSKLFADQYERIKDKIKIEEKSIEKKISVKIDIDWEEENEIFAEASVPVYTDMIKARGDRTSKLIGRTFEITQEVKDFIKKKAIKFSDEVNKTTEEMIKRVIAEGIDEGEGHNEISKRIKEVYTEREKRGAERIARTEMTSASGEADIESFKQGGLEKKEWKATEDDRTRDSHLEVDGEVVELDKEFSNGLKFPGDPSADPEEVCNCRCTLLPVVE